jgi:hypothetical protein
LDGEKQIKKKKERKDSEIEKAKWEIKKLKTGGLSEAAGPMGGCD